MFGIYGYTIEQNRSMLELSTQLIWSIGNLLEFYLCMEMLNDEHIYIYIHILMYIYTEKIFPIYTTNIRTTWILPVYNIDSNLKMYKINLCSS